MAQSSNDTEVENVLAAIRRLIEEGGAEGPTPFGRLVLTPAQRVMAPSEPLPPAGAQAASIAAPSDGGAIGDLQPAASAPLVLLNALPVADAPPPAPFEQTESGLPDGPGAEEERVRAFAADDAIPAEDPDLADLASDPGAEEVVLAQMPEQPPGGATPSHEPLPTEDPRSAPLQEISTSDPARSDATASTLADAPVAVEQDGDPGPGAASGEMGPPSDLAAPGQEPTPDAGLPSQAPDSGHASPPAPWPDEATLRALVAEAVREELRGELGETLTRNLRKLVRREVMQALALRDL
ncbi:hypothetical protein Rumeso_01947 [Rubellimicrobium mesophilum DSM 19309]|uniref:Uncharacterized protein n=1 Tax=Rubellimicrobium mesophilum DSM 19309 TaxID=442562 RepID=A0A017HQA7_9RHOB|nr:hypothetical protein [Rubellimicrobium mesophilum]EYD76526.1 hypothetical protein Rumeso_01947 [Rubellimicrobium mesophilum DSM 19309]